jgi:hypothetical protein
MSPKRLKRSRLVTLALDDSNSCVRFELEWLEQNLTQRYLSGGVASATDLGELVRTLDRLPRTLDPHTLQYCDCFAPDDTRVATHHVRFVLPGWKEDQGLNDWYLPTQLPLPFVPGIGAYTPD